MTTPLPDQLLAVLSTAKLGRTPIVGTVAFGISDTGAQQTFAFCFANDSITVDASGVDPSVIVVMKRDDWAALAASLPVGLPLTLYNSTPTIRGNLPFFIRHLHAIVDAVGVVSPLLSQADPPL
jgi:hypothetical protein